MMRPETRRTAWRILAFGLGIGVLALWFPLTAFIIGGFGGIFFSGAPNR